jgi:hypothetical protein
MNAKRNTIGNYSTGYAPFQGQRAGATNCRNLGSLAAIVALPYFAGFAP